jgi:alkanesulfonate monooxygenase SsuD/methylene tetrahydromethanopterin reductase-like flavin-dependent oxidoreductase (luciferase family)
MASTLDAISDGRLDLGIGAGWFEDEYRRFGYDFSTTGSRIAQLAEALEIIKGIWTFPKFTYEGKFYAVQDAFCAPKPIQRPHPPIWVGGKGEKMLRLVVKYGDACNFSSLSPSECSALLTKLANYAQEAGRNLGRLTKSYMALVFYAADSDSAKSKIPKYLADLPTSVVDSTIGESFFQRRIVGGPDECIRRIQEYEAAGIDYLQLYFPDLSEELLSSFAEEVTESF